MINKEYLFFHLNESYRRLMDASSSGRSPLSREGNLCRDVFIYD